MSTPSTFFDIPADREPRRNTETGAPQLIPRGLEATGVRSDYTRASYMADYVEDKSHIHKWEMRYLCKAMGRNEDLAALAAVETYSTGISDAVFGRDKSASGRRLDDIIRRALDRVRIHEKADRGTAIHGATEPGGPRGVDRLRPGVDAFEYANRTEAIELVATEVFTANDEIMAAGTFDHLIRVPGHPLLTDYVVADKKTGRFDPFSWCIQMATYAYGEPYNLDTDERPGWPGHVNLEWGLVWQIDSDDETCSLWVVDIAFGWRMAQLAAQVRDAHKQTDIFAPYQSAPFTRRLDASSSHADLTRLWHAVENDPIALAAVEEKARSL